MKETPLANDNWIVRAIEQYKADTKDVPKWMLDAYAPKPSDKKPEPEPKK